MKVYLQAFLIFCTLSKAAFLNPNHFAKATRFYQDWVAADKHSCFMVHYYHVYVPPSIKKDILML